MTYQPHQSEDATLKPVAHHPKKHEPWICLLCTSPIRGVHWTLNDGKTPCPNGRRRPAAIRGQQP